MIKEIIVVIACSNRIMDISKIIALFSIEELTITDINNRIKFAFDGENEPSYKTELFITNEKYIDVIHKIINLDFTIIYQDKENKIIEVIKYDK